MEEFTTAELEALYSKETSKLALLAQKVQIAKHQNLVKEKITEAGDFNVKMLGLKVDMEALSAEHLALKKRLRQGRR
jgi:hypothetical protein